MDRNYWAQSYISCLFDSLIPTSLTLIPSLSIKIKHYVSNKILETTYVLPTEQIINFRYIHREETQISCYSE